METDVTLILNTALSQMFGLPSYHLAHLCTTCTKSVTSQDVSEVATVDKIHTVDVVRSPQRKS